MGKGKSKSVYGAMEAVVSVAAALVLLLLSVMNLSGRAYMPMNWYEHIIFKNNDVFFYLSLAAGIIALLAAFRFISKISPKILFIACNAVFAAAGLFLIVNAPSVLRADTGSVYHAAQQFNEGSYSALEFGGYMYMYPHQLGLATLWRPFASFGFGVYAVFAANLLMALAANFAVWSSARLVWGEGSPAVNYICIMLFLFMPHLFFILFAYGLTPGLAFLCLAVYFGVRYMKGKGRSGGVLCILFAALSCVVRNNNYIGIIAIGAGFVLCAVRDKKTIRLVYPAAMLALTVLLPSAVKWGYGAAAKTPVNDGMPKTLWIAMGLQDNSFRMDGWSNAYNEQTYIHNDCDAEKSSALAKADIKKRLEYFANNPDKAYVFFRNKLRSTWTEPTFQSLWSGPLEDCGQQIRTGFLKNLYGEGAAYRAINRFLAVLVTLIYISALAAIVYGFVTRKKIGFFGSVICMYLIGGFLFHLFWETKSQYVYPYVYLLIPFAAGGMAEIAERFNRQFLPKK